MELEQLSESIFVIFVGPVQTSPVLGGGGETEYRSVCPDSGSSDQGTYVKGISLTADANGRLIGMLLTCSSNTSTSTGLRLYVNSGQLYKPGQKVCVLTV